MQADRLVSSQLTVMIASTVMIVLTDMNCVRRQKKRARLKVIKNKYENTLN